MVPIMLCVLAIACFALCRAGLPEADGHPVGSAWMDAAFWPPQVALTEPLLDDSGGVEVPAGRLGALAWVRADGRLRADFGRFGAHTVSIERTDLLPRMQALRDRPASKTHPNLVLMIGNRMVDAASGQLQMHRFTTTDPEALLLMLFDDPSDAGFAARVADVDALANDRRLVAAVLFPIGDAADEADAEVLDRLVAAGWRGRFESTSYARGDADALLDDGTTVPWLRLCTVEGRILAEGPPTPEIRAAIESLLDERGGGRVATE